MVVLAIGLLATLGLVSRAGALIRRADAEEGASRVASEVLDSLMQHGAPGPGALARDRYRASWAAVRDTAGVTWLTLVLAYDDGSRIRSDTFAARAAPWPRAVPHVP